MLAELHADGGAAASGEDFFRASAFLRAEGVTHTLAAGPALVPLVVREIPGTEGRLDAISPYGYPGAAVAPGVEPIAPGAVDWSATGLVSLFVRDRIGPPPAFAGGTERSLVQVHDPGRIRGVRSRLAEQIRSNEREGWRVAVATGPASSVTDRAAFHALYAETMRRTGAPRRYLFEPSYFDAVLGIDRTWLLLAHSPNGEPGAGAIVVRSDGMLHYYLGGTSNAALDASPFKNVVLAMLDLADEAGMALNLGGGVSAGDGLERFKRGFANATAPFVAHEIVCDAAAYGQLVDDRDAGGYFPAYRAP